MPVSTQPPEPRETVPLIVRLSHEYPKPKDPYDFQAKCTVLFRAELKDRNAQEYGRNGQKQRGIDILGRRDGKPDHWVGIQTRKIEKPLQFEKILSDCRDTLALKADLKEIIFATTAKNDTGAQDAAIDVEKILRDEGRDLSVTVHGWDNLCSLIAEHPTAYQAFNPSSVSTEARQEEALGDENAELRKQMSALSAQLAAFMPSVPTDNSSAEDDGEDKALHAKIDTFRDLFKNDRQLGLAEAGLKALLGSFDAAKQSRAEFRINYNLGSIALEVGREDEAAAYYEKAYELRPDDPMAVASLGVARILEKRYDEAMVLEQRALTMPKPADFAVGYLIQAAARSTWQGDPEALIPERLKGTPDADLGLAEFLRLREEPGWPRRVIDLSARHSDNAVFKRLSAQAVLYQIASDNSYLPGGKAAPTPAEVNAAADVMKEQSEFYIKAEAKSLAAIATISNTAVILRYCRRNTEAEKLLEDSIAHGATDDGILRMLGLIQTLVGKKDQALKTLEPLVGDKEARLLRAEIVGEKDARQALALLAEIPDDVVANYNNVRWELYGEFAARLGDAAEVERAIKQLHGVGAQKSQIEFLRLRLAKASGAPEAELAERARAISETISPDISMPDRVLIANQLREFERPLEASRLLEGHVDLRRLSAATVLYLQSLAGARRDEAFLKAYRSSAQEVRDSADILWLKAAHDWNIGDLDSSLANITALLVKHPDNFRARLLKLELLIRQNKLGDLSNELVDPIETMPSATLSHRLRLVTILSNFGFADRAGALAYRLFLEHVDDYRVWMAVTGFVLFEKGSPDAPALEVEAAGPNVAVDLNFEGGTTSFFIIEPDPTLRTFDREAIEPDHPVALAVAGKAVGDEVEIDGRKGTIDLLRHKYVARFHYVLNNVEKRFPDFDGLRGVHFDPTVPGGLDEFRAMLSARDDWVRQQTELYAKNNWPLEVLAQMTGTSVLEAAGGIASFGVKLKVAFGRQDERQAAKVALFQNAKRGCVFDLWTYTTAFALGALDTVRELCGDITVTQHTLDRLRIQRAQLAEGAGQSRTTAGIANGQITVTEFSADAVQQRVDYFDRAIFWIEENGAAKAARASDHLPDYLLEHLQTTDSHIFDEIILAIDNDVMLVSDDLFMRQMGASVGVDRTAWLHWLAGAALDRKKISSEQYVDWSANLIDAGQNYLGVTGNVLTVALAEDAAQGAVAPGRKFIALASMIGGEPAEPASHVRCVMECLVEIWSKYNFAGLRMQATSHLLQKLLRDRYKDYREILARVYIAAHQNNTDLARYIFGWARGHFITGVFKP